MRFLKYKEDEKIMDFLDSIMTKTCTDFDLDHTFAAYLPSGKFVLTIETKIECSGN